MVIKRLDNHPTSDVGQESGTCGSERFEDFIAEIDNVELDIRFLTETWRDESDELVATPGGHRLSLAGGSGHSGVGICLSKSLLPKISKSCRQRSGLFPELSMWLQKFHSLFVLFPNNLGFDK